MPFCEGCHRFYNPNTLTAEGDCPAGHHVADPGTPETPAPVPWHFWVMLAALVVYLAWRFAEVVGWFI